MTARADGRELTTRFVLAVQRAGDALASGDLGKLQRARQGLLRAHGRWANMLGQYVVNESEMEAVTGLAPPTAELFAARSNRLLVELREARDQAIAPTATEELTASLERDLDELLSEEVQP